MHLLRTFLASLIVALAASAASAQSAGVPPDAQKILAQAKAVTGGPAWDTLISQHSKVKITAGGVEGSAERWASLLTGRSRMRYELGSASGVIGYDGVMSWASDASGQVHVQSSANAVALAANAAYRDRLAFWYPERQAATIAYVRRDRADGADFDIIRIIPDGGRPYEIWVNVVSHRIERLREPENGQVRTEEYSDFRTVQGVMLPFTVRVAHGDTNYDERYVVEAIEYNVPLDGVAFSPPTPAPRQVKP